METYTGSIPSNIGYSGVSGQLGLSAKEDNFRRHMKLPWRLHEKYNLKVFESIFGKKFDEKTDGLVWRTH